MFPLDRFLRPKSPASVFGAFFYFALTPRYVRSRMIYVDRYIHRSPHSRLACSTSYFSHRSASKTFNNFDTTFQYRSTNDPNDLFDFIDPSHRVTIISYH